jgi:hypothetical protein
MKKLVMLVLMIFILVFGMAVMAHAQDAVMRDAHRTAPVGLSVSKGAAIERNNNNVIAKEDPGLWNNSFGIFSYDAGNGVLLIAAFDYDYNEAFGYYVNSYNQVVPFTWGYDPTVYCWLKLLYGHNLYGGLCGSGTVVWHYLAYM